MLAGGCRVSDELSRRLTLVARQLAQRQPGAAEAFARLIEANGKHPTEVEVVVGKDGRVEQMERYAERLSRELRTIRLKMHEMEKAFPHTWDDFERLARAMGYQGLASIAEAIGASVEFLGARRDGQIVEAQVVTALLKSGPKGKRRAPNRQTTVEDIDRQIDRLQQRRRKLLAP